MSRIKLNNFSFFIGLITIVFTGFSCKRHKNIQKQETPVVTQLPPDSLNDKCKLDYKNGKALTNLLKTNELDFSYATGKFACELTVDGEEHSFTVSVKCRKDSVIWLSISKLGIEAARVLIKRDTVKIRIDLPDKQYFVGDYTYINQLLHADLDYDMLQGLLFGNSASFYSEDEKLSGGKDRDSCVYFLSTLRKKETMRIVHKQDTLKESTQIMWLHPETFKILHLIFEDVVTKRKFKASYSNFETVGNFKAPFKLDYVITAEKVINASIKYAKININEKTEFPFKIPKGYDPIEIKKKPN